MGNDGMITRLMKVLTHINPLLEQLDIVIHGQYPCTHPHTIHLFFHLNMHERQFPVHKSDDFCTYRPPICDHLTNTLFFCCLHSYHQIHDAVA